MEYVRYYDHLIHNYDTRENCKTILKKYLFDKWTAHINSCYLEGSHSRLGVYKCINPDMVKHTMQEDLIIEHERKIITRYRCGTRNLKIETGRWEQIPRELRLCICNNAIQSLHHVLIECPLLRLHRPHNIQNIHDFFILNNDTILDFLNQISKVQRIKI